MPADFLAFCPYVSRPDLLLRVVASCRTATIPLAIINNSGQSVFHDPNGGNEPPENVIVIDPPVPLSFTQSMNLEFKLAKESGARYCLHMHSDAVIPSNVFAELLDYARQMDADDRKWGVLYTFYDILACYKVEAVLAVGGYDTKFDSYFSDNDMWRRLRLAGYECHDTNIQGVSHEGSATINSDAKLQLIHQVMFPFARMYYMAKHGGEPDRETFRFPFNRPDFGLKP